MLDSTLLEVVIGLILLYLLLSVAVSAFNELAEGLLKRRSKYLLATFDRLGGPELVDELYGTTWVRSLGGYAHSLNTQQLQGTKPFGEKKPSYIPVDVFVEALRELRNDITEQAGAALDKLDAGGTIDEIVELLPPRIRKQLPEGKIAAAALREEIERLIPVALDEIAALFPVGVLDDLEAEATKLRRWFEYTMDRMSGWYGRQTKWLLMVWGVIFALLLNIDSFNVAGTLWSDEVVRDAAVAAAEGATQGDDPTDCQPAEDDPYSCVDDALTKLKAAEGLGIPMGWPSAPWNWGDPVLDGEENPIAGLTVGDDPRIPQGAGAWIYRLLGIAATGAAVAMGAPFWFNLLNKFVNFRAAGPKPKRTETEVVAE